MSSCSLTVVDIVNSPNITIRSYYNQILYGCTNPYCKTPTCRSCRKRLSKGPFRPYTKCSARALANFLASEDCPYKGLCPHPPASSPSTDSELGLVNGETSHEHQVHSAITEDARRRVSSPSRKSLTQDRVELPFNKDVSDQNGGRKNARSIRECTRTNVHVYKVRDSKSFVQSIFDTAAIMDLHIAKPRDNPEETIFHDEAGAHTPSGDVCQELRPAESSLSSSVQTLSYFTWDNIDKLMDILLSDHLEIYKQHELLYSMGLVDARFLRISLSFDIDNYQDFLAFVASSMTYILGNLDPLAQSFLRSEDLNHLDTVCTYELSSLIGRFIDLRRLDFPPTCIFTTLQSVASQLCALNISLKKRSSFNDGSESSQISVHGFKFYHITKVIFASLIASIREHDMPTWNYVTAMRAAGRATTPTPIVGSASYQKLVRKAHDVMAAFEDQAALDLLRTLLRAIAAQNHSVDRDEIPSTSDGVRDYKSYSSIYSCTLHYLFEDLLPETIGQPTISPEIMKGERHKFGSAGLKIAFEEQPSRVLIEWLRSVLLIDWDGRPQVRRCSAVGSALECLKCICKLHSRPLSSALLIQSHHRQSIQVGHRTRSILYSILGRTFGHVERCSGVGQLCP